MDRVCGVLAIALTMCALLRGDDRNLSKKRFELVYTPDAAHARGEYRSLVAGIENLRGDEKNCRSDWFKQARESGVGWKACRFFPPFPLASELAVDPTVQSWFGWAPVSEIPEAASAVQHWRELADKGVPYHCAGAICEVTIRALNRVQGEDVLAACKVIGDENGTVGAPWDCTPYAIIAQDSVWAKIVSGYTEVQNRTLGLPDFDLAVISKDLPNVPSFLAGTEVALSSSPLALTTKIETKSTRVGTLFGTSQYVPSQVLESYKPRLREIATVRVDAFEEKDGEISYVRLSVSTNLLVNTLASSDPNDWHRPNPPQEDDYVKAVQSNLKKYLERSCQQATWRSNRVLTCGLPNNTSLPVWALQ
jgi:hypothetical protein